MIELKYSFEYFCSPTWIKEKSDNVFENIPIEGLPLDDDLKREIEELDLIFQSTYNEDYPPEPINLTLDEEFIFCKRIINSFFKMKKLLPSNYILLFNFSLWKERLKKADKNVLKSNLNRETNINNDKITYSIISRGEIIIGYSNNTVNLSIRVTGELTFQPPTFYADLSVFERETNLSEDIKKQIINFIENDSEKKIGTKIIFD